MRYGHVVNLQNHQNSINQLNIINSRLRHVAPIFSYTTCPQGLVWLSTLVLSPWEKGGFSTHAIHLVVDARVCTIVDPALL